MTRMIFFDDCYAKEGYATVTATDGGKVELDTSVFCYQGGGQLSDKGVVKCGSGEYAIVDVKKEGGRLIHYLDREGLKTGDNVHCILDWERRHKLMRYHTAAHILSAIVNKKTGALITGNQITPEEARFDFSLEDFDREKVLEYVAEANAAIATSQDIRMYFLPRAEALNMPGMVKLANALPPQVDPLRIVEIGNIDTQADGGTHVKNTSEIGRIEVIKLENKGKSNRRIYFRLV